MFINAENNSFTTFLIEYHCVGCFVPSETNRVLKAIACWNRFLVLPELSSGFQQRRDSRAVVVDAGAARHRVEVRPDHNHLHNHPTPLQQTLEKLFQFCQYFLLHLKHFISSL